MERQVQSMLCRTPRSSAGTKQRSLTLVTFRMKQEMSVFEEGVPVPALHPLCSSYYCPVYYTSHSAPQFVSTTSVKTGEKSEAEPETLISKASQ